MSTYEIRRNPQFNSNELYFNTKPAKEILAALKNLKMRWNPKKGCWYGFVDESEIINAISENTEIEDFTTIATDGYLGAGGYKGTNYHKWRNSQELKNLIIDLVKKYVDCKISIRTGKATYTTSLTITLKLNDKDFVTKEKYIKNYDLLNKNWGWVRREGKSDIYWNDFIELPEEEKEIIKSYNANLDWNYNKEELHINQHHINKNEFLSETGKKKIETINQIIMSCNYDESNSMVDYFSTGFYYNIRVKRNEE